jgi:hypothetical protein
MFSLGLGLMIGLFLDFEVVEPQKDFTVFDKLLLRSKQPFRF